MRIAVLLSAVALSIACGMSAQAQWTSLNLRQVPDRRAPAEVLLYSKLMGGVAWKPRALRAPRAQYPL